MADNDTWRSLLVHAWALAGERRLVIANLSAGHAQARIALPWADVGSSWWRLHDLVNGASSNRDGAALASDGLYVDLPGYFAHWFTLTKL